MKPHGKVLLVERVILIGSTPALLVLESDVTDVISSPVVIPRSPLLSAAKTIASKNAVLFLWASLACPAQTSG
jgi:hypothetical protein